jgi:hypothetical protein
MKTRYFLIIAHTVATVAAVFFSGAAMLGCGLLTIVFFGDNPTGNTAAWLERFSSLLWTFALGAALWGLNFCAYLIAAGRKEQGEKVVLHRPPRLGTFSKIAIAVLGVVGVATFGAGVMAFRAR